MTRKVKLWYMAKDSARKATFRKRKKGLWKKVSELSSTLCGIDVCAIVYNPYDNQPSRGPNDRVSIQEKTRDGAKQEDGNSR
ncbi:hypothetical protein Dsin_009436 [Dipteronia sinensis]|uniref:MADS-box domain-containing protein n=1 Tax=Dipteronia sinensis TaxID=43782 RepID=A0AAE0EBR2_9ROSI|nr:hypothetical protein Dsin_009436 [Dipteronia sinensis]